MHRYIIPLAVEEGEPVYLREHGLYPMALYVDPYNFCRERSEFCVTLKILQRHHIICRPQNKRQLRQCQIPALIGIVHFS